MSTLRYRVISDGGMYIGEKLYPRGSVVNLTLVAARYLLLSGIIVLASEQAPPAVTPTAPTEDDVRIPVQINGQDKLVSLTEFVILFPSLALPAEQLAAGISGVIGTASTSGDTLGKLDVRLTAVEEIRADVSDRTTGICSTTIGGHRMVRSIGPAIETASAQERSHVGTVFGLSLSSGRAGTRIPIQLSGLVIEPSWSFSPGPIWLGSFGSLQQQPPSSGFVQKVATAITPTSIMLSLEDPIVLG